MKAKQHHPLLRRRGWFHSLAVLWLAGAVAVGDVESADEGGLPPPGDPFAFRSTGMEDGFVSVTPAALPAGIRVVGILTPREGKAVGVLDIPGAGTLHFVREGDVIQIDPPPVARHVAPIRDDRLASDARQPVATQPQPFTPSPGSPVYLLIVSIGENQIEIAPRARPHDTRIYR